MKHLITKLGQFLARFYFSLRVILTLGLQTRKDEEENNNGSDQGSEQKGDQHD